MDSQVVMGILAALIAVILFVAGVMVKMTRDIVNRFDNMIQSHEKRISELEKLVAVDSERFTTLHGMVLQLGKDVSALMERISGS